MKQREIQVTDGTIWACVQAYTGLNHSPENEKAAKVEGKGNKVKVVCTPSGGAQTVRLELPQDWLEDLSDEDLESQIVSATPGD
jgi:hypothetical protein